MSASTKIKWVVSIVLAGFLLFLAMIGGKWGTPTAANAGPETLPVIDFIIPDAVPAGSNDIIMIISGDYFTGALTDTRVWMEGVEGVITDIVLTPLQMLPTGVSVFITDTLLAVPAKYNISVIHSRPGSIPHPPPDPQWDDVSNKVPFLVYLAKYFFLPIIGK